MQLELQRSLHQKFETGHGMCRPNCIEKNRRIGSRSPESNASGNAANDLPAALASSTLLQIVEAWYYNL
jgi:hypothetical protein